MVHAPRTGLFPPNRAIENLKLETASSALVTPSSSKTQFPPKSAARSGALTVLQKVARHGQLADEALDQFLEQSSFRKPDRGLIVELVYGVLRYRDTLDWRLNLVADRPMTGVPVAVAMILRLGAYQIVYLDRIPTSAAVNESVTLARSIRGRDWTGFVNGVLRNLVRQGTPRWPEPSDDLNSYLSIRYSCPSWMVERWLAFYGPSKAEQLCQATLRIPPITLRTNTLRCSRQDLLSRLRKDGYEVRETLVSPVGVVLQKCGSLREIKAIQDGWCYVEDEAAQLIPPLLNVSAEHRVLDVCAAPGGKTTQLAALMHNQGTVVALDRNPQRLRTLTANCKKLGVTNVLHFVADSSDELLHPARSGALMTHVSQGFDRILVDAPCSGLGVLRRHPEGKWAKEADIITRSQTRQLEILDRVCPLLRPHGVLVYSACSTELEETYQVLARFSRQHPEFLHESVEQLVPSAGRCLIDQDGNLFTPFNDFDMDGFFAARLRKIGTL